MTRVLAIGDVVTDIVAVYSGQMAFGSDTAASISLNPGGAAANTAAWLAAVGVPVGLSAVVGADPAGADRVAELAAAGVDVSGVRRADSAATGSIIVLVREGERSFLCDRGANLLLAPSDVEDAIEGATHVHLSGYTLFDPASRPAGLRALAAARTAGVTSSVDAASAAPLRFVGGALFLSWVRGADVLFATEEEARALLDDDASAPAVLAARLAEWTRLAVVKLGPRGAVSAGSGVVEVAARPAEVVDPTGAGDAFAAGFLASWLEGAGVAAALRHGADLGALAVARVGARP
jgi:sugar/nucleoside kinase (ribokinase family)